MDVFGQNENRDDYPQLGAPVAERRRVTFDLCKTLGRVTLPEPTPGPYSRHLKQRFANVRYTNNLEKGVRRADGSARCVTSNACQSPSAKAPGSSSLVLAQSESPKTMAKLGSPRVALCRRDGATQRQRLEENPARTWPRGANRPNFQAINSHAWNALLTNRRRQVLAGSPYQKRRSQNVSI